LRTHTNTQMGAGKSVWQRHFYCHTCGNFDEEVDPICVACASRCHPGHDLYEADPDDVVCECGAKHHKCR
jgi:hypothetical protein